MQLGKNQLLLSPPTLAGFALIYSGGEGIQASLVTNYVGKRFFDMQNTIVAGSYITIDTTLGYAFDCYYGFSQRLQPDGPARAGVGERAG